MRSSASSARSSRITSSRTTSSPLAVAGDHARGPDAADPVGTPPRLERPQPARRLEQAGGLELAALQVALDPDLRVPGVGALEELAPRQRRPGLRQRLDLLRPTVGRQV